MANNDDTDGIMFRRVLLLSFFGLSVCQSLWAENSNWVVTSYIDASYNYLVRSNRFISGTYNRVNDLDPNGFTLQQWFLTIANQPTQGFGMYINTIVGRDAGGIAPAGMNPDWFDSQNLQVAIPQANVQYVTNNWTFKAGEMLTLSGIELFDYTKDDNFSRSIIDGYAQPGVHLGLRALDHVNEQMNLIVGLNNGWATVKRAMDMDALELGFNYIPSSRFSLMIDSYTGRQHLTDRSETGPTSWRNLIDCFGTWYITDQWNVSANYDYGVQSEAALPNSQIGRAVWQGIAGYINFIMNDRWNTTLRGEIFEDTNGYRTGVKQNWRELTLTLAYTPLKSLEISAETRHDFSNVGAFLNSDGYHTNNNQQSFALALLYKFL